MSEGILKWNIRILGTKSPRKCRYNETRLQIKWFFTFKTNTTPPKQIKSVYLSTAERSRKALGTTCRSRSGGFSIRTICREGGADLNLKYRKPLENGFKNDYIEDSVTHWCIQQGHRCWSTFPRGILEYSRKTFSTRVVFVIKHR